MSPKGARRKGIDAERELVRALNTAGLAARRVPMSGALPFTESCDVLILGADGKWVKVEAKIRKALSVARWLRKADLVMMREDRGPWLVLVPLSRYAELALTELVCAGPIADPKPGPLELVTIAPVCGEGA